MPIDHIAFPLPVVVKGYACLNGAEIELAEKDIDPARPESALAPLVPPAAAAPPRDDAPRVISYAPGSVRRADGAKATIYSITA